MRIGKVAAISIILIAAFAVSLAISIMFPNASTYFKTLTGSVLPPISNYQSLVCGAGSFGTCPVPGSECPTGNATCVYPSCNCVVNENQNVPSGITYSFNSFKINAGKIVNIQTGAIGNGVDGGNAGRGGAGGHASYICCYTSNPSYLAYSGGGGGGGPGAGGGSGKYYGGSYSGSGGGIQSIGIGGVIGAAYTTGAGSSSVINGGAGGGGVAIVAGNITIDGEMHADGGTGTSGSGGGGGGLIILSGDSISVSGSVTANGGDAGQVSSCGSGGGGGGYIKIISTSAVNIRQGALSVSSGVRSANSCTGTSALGWGPSYVAPGAASAGNIDYVTSLAENCTNGIDDNGNGLIDCTDPGCVNSACSLSGCTAAGCGSTSCNTIGYWDNPIQSNLQKCCPNANYCVSNETSSLTDCKAEGFQRSDNYGCFRGKWSLCNAAGVEGTQTDSTGKTYYCCPSGSSYIWRSVPCGIPESTTTTTSTTTTSSTSSTSTSTSTSTSSTTTTTPQASFSGTNFTCSLASGVWSCRFDYSNSLGEKAVIVFLYADSNGNIVSSPAPVVEQGSGSTGSMFYCSSFPSGSYFVTWKAYKLSDSSLSDPVKWSKANERQTITC
jgi:hypothetical protein